MKPTDQTGPNPALVSGAMSFDALLDETCIRLADTRSQGVMKRLKKMENTLLCLEEELTAMLEDVFPAEVSRP